MKTILITGASSGIGRATALHLDNQGFRVYATVRSTKDADSLPSTISPILLDLQHPGEIEAVASQMDLKQGLFALINNAAQNYISSFEDSTEEGSRALMETNFFGLATLTRSLIPHLRKYALLNRQSTARILNISSIGGLIGIPWEPFYHASKFAVYGITESLRLELWHQGIRATVVCPGAIGTPLLPKTFASSEAAIATSSNPQYAASLRAFANMAHQADRFSLPAEKAAAIIGNLLKDPNPPFRKLIGLDAKIMLALSRLLPTSLFHVILRAAFVASPDQSQAPAKASPTPPQSPSPRQVP